MNARQALKESMDSPTMIAKAYLEDLSDADLLIRPVEGANHIAWQLGHLISSEHNMIEMVCPGSMPALPDGFAENTRRRHRRRTMQVRFTRKNSMLPRWMSSARAHWPLWKI